MKKALINQPAGLGDILLIQPMVDDLLNRGYEVFHPVADVYSYLHEYIQKDNYHLVKSDDERIPDDYNDHVMNPHTLSDDTEVYTLRFSDYIETPQGIQYFPEPVKAKYIRWGWNHEDIDYRDNLEIIRNEKRENDLKEYLEKNHDINFDEDYIVINRQYGTPPDSKKREMELFDLPSDVQCLEMEYIEGTRLFDWIDIIKNAKEFHTVNTAIVYIMESVGLEGVRKVQYGRRLLRDNPDHDWLLMSKSSDRDIWEYIN